MSTRCSCLYKTKAKRALSVVPLALRYTLDRLTLVGSLLSSCIATHCVATCKSIVTIYDGTCIERGTAIGARLHQMRPRPMMKEEQSRVPTET
jgi:hypothetical protein